MPRIHVEHHDRISSGDREICFGPHLPPLANLIRIGRCIFEAMQRPRMLSDVPARCLLARTSDTVGGELWGMAGKDLESLGRKGESCLDRLGIGGAKIGRHIWFSFWANQHPACQRGVLHLGHPSFRAAPLDPLIDGVRWHANNTPDSDRLQLTSANQLPDF